MVNVKVKEKRPFDTVGAIADAAKILENELDGPGSYCCAIRGQKICARVMIEGKDQNEIAEQANRLADIIKNALN